MFKNINKQKKIGGAISIYENILWHGTSMYYIDDIKKNGLDGKYPDEIYNKMVLLNNEYPFLKNATYVNWFFERQEKKRNDNKVSLSFTTQIATAMEFASGVRASGEGPTKYLDEINKNKLADKNTLANELKTIIDNIQKYPGIILAIKLSDYVNLKSSDDLINEYETGKYEMYINGEKKLPIEYEWQLRKKIPPEIIYIYDMSTMLYIKLLSVEGNNFIYKTLKNNFKKILEKAKKAKNDIPKYIDHYKEHPEDISRIDNVIKLYKQKIKILKAKAQIKECYNII